KGTKILLFGPPGVGKTHLSAALGHALVESGHRVLFGRTTELVEQLQAARQDLKLAATIEKLDKYDLLILDDLSYVQKSQAETSVLAATVIAGSGKMASQASTHCAWWLASSAGPRPSVVFLL